MARRVPKILLHGDGTPFCVWNPEGKPVAYAMYFTDDDVPPAPESLDIRQTGYDRDMRGMYWQPVEVWAERTEMDALIEPYDADED